MDLDWEKALGGKQERKAQGLERCQREGKVLGGRGTGRLLASLPLLLSLLGMPVYLIH